MLPANTVDQPGLLSLVGENRVITRYRKWSIRLFFTIGYISIISQINPINLYAIFGSFIGICFWITVSYRLLSRPGTTNELQSVKLSDQSKPTPNYCRECGSEIPSMVSECSKCGWKPTQKKEN